MCVHVCVHVCVCACVCVRACVVVCMCTHACLHASLPAWVHVHGVWDLYTYRWLGDVLLALVTIIHTYTQMTTSSSESESDDSDTDYIPTPLRISASSRVPARCLSDQIDFQSINPCVIPAKCCFFDLRQLQYFTDQINRGCRESGCQGKLTPLNVDTRGMGGATNITYRCNQCLNSVYFQQATNSSIFGGNDISLAVQVAFITAGCTHATYAKILQLLGIEPVSSSTFMTTIKKLHPIVEQMVKEMCEREKNRMRNIDQDKLGSWKHAVTCADGTWMTRGYHSKNATFTIRNYFTGALLYVKHICQKGHDNVIKEELYKGTSKSAEGYSARELMLTAKEEGLNIDTHWQDADSSSSKSVEEVFPKAKIMICGGHAGRSHLKQLQKLGKKKSFTKKFKDIYREQFPEVDSAKCNCENGRHHTGCGCLSDAFCQRARNNFSTILSESETPKEFSERLQGLVHHVQDKHEWDGGKCQFHPLSMYSCGKCPGKDNYKCEGKEYHTREVLNCPFHLLVYKIACYVRSQMADKLVHEFFKRGHSNWLESSHNVFIRFRPKHIFLERLHYHVSTNIGLLQANMTNEYHQQGAAYHWKADLLQRLNLPIYSGVQELLESLNHKRKKVLDTIATTKAKKRRVELKSQRTNEAQQRKLWSKEHGHDTYGEADDIKQDEEKLKKKQKQKKKLLKKPCKHCGSKNHSLPTHKNCPFNIKQKAAEYTADNTATCSIGETSTLKATEYPVDNTATSYIGKTSTLSDDGCKLPEHTDCQVTLVSKALSEAPQSETEYEASDKMSSFSLSDEMSERSADLGEEYVSLLMSDDELDLNEFEDAVISACNCGGLNRAHKKTCPMNSRARYGTRKPESKPIFKPGDYVCLHNSFLKDKHIYCRVVECMSRPAGSLYRLCCTSGVLAEIYPETELTQSVCINSIPLDKWRTMSRVRLRVAQNDSCNTQKCDCKKMFTERSMIDLTEVSEQPIEKEDKIWIQNPLYILHESDRKLITSSSGWLNDKIITASQLLLAQHFPGIDGLQPPTLEQINGFQVHTGKYVQFLNVRRNHWIFVSNLGCKEDVVYVYDTMYSSLPASTVDTVARLAFCSSSALTIKMVDVDHQKNSSDCGVLCLAIAFDLLSAQAPIVARYNHKLIRRHLLNCLSAVYFSPFPTLGELTSSNIKYKTTMKVPVFCVCRMPEHPGEKWAECEKCFNWYHKYCLDIPDSVFDETLNDSWKCPNCRSE